MLANQETSCFIRNTRRCILHFSSIFARQVQEIVLRPVRISHQSSNHGWCHTMSRLTSDTNRSITKVSSITLHGDELIQADVPGSGPLISVSDVHPTLGGGISSAMWWPVLLRKVVSTWTEHYWPWMEIITRHFPSSPRKILLSPLKFRGASPLKCSDRFTSEVYKLSATVAC